MFIDPDLVKKGLLQFNSKTHRYTVDGHELTSVTKLISQYTQPFNAIFASNAKAKKNKRDNTGITDPILLRKYWKLNGEYRSTLGTATHLFSELYMLDRSITPSNGSEKAVIAAIKELEKEFIIIGQEEQVFDTELLLAGTIDLILEHKKTKQLYIGDWKTTKDMYKTYNKLYSPINLQNSPLVKYSIQANIYCMLKSCPLNNKLIIQLNDDETFKIFYNTDIPNTDKETKAILEERRKYVSNNKR